MFADPQYWAIPAAISAALAYLLAAVAVLVLPKPVHGPGSAWVARGAGFLGGLLGVWLVVYLVFWNALRPPLDLVLELTLGLGAYLASLHLRPAWLARLLFNLGLSLMALSLSVLAVHSWVVGRR